jgi:hypothetical protein
LAAAITPLQTAREAPDELAVFQARGELMHQRHAAITCAAPAKKTCMHAIRTASSINNSSALRVPELSAAPIFS